MSDHRTKTVARALAGREGFLQLLLVGVLLALGTNLLATAITSSLPWSTAVPIGLGLLIAVGGYSVRAALAAREIFRSFDAVLVLSPDDLQPCETVIYPFSKDIARILRAVFCENKAFAEAWQHEPVTKYWDRGEDIGTCTRSTSTAGLTLLNEALETWLIQELSMQLTDYYGQIEHSERYTVTLERKDVPSLLLENRILNLLSTPVTDRSVFAADSKADRGVSRVCHGEEVVYFQVGPNGAVFERFELALPRGSRLSRQDSGALTIDTPRLHLDLSARHDGFTANLPSRFVSRYLGRDPGSVRSLLVHIELAGRVKPLGLLHRRGWDLYRWVDAFADAVEENASFETMLQRIHWPALEAMLIAKEAPPGSEEGV